MKTYFQSIYFMVISMVLLQLVVPVANDFVTWINENPFRLLITLLGLFISWFIYLRNYNELRN